MENRREYILNNLKEKYDYLVKHGYNVLALFLQGSQNYNLDVYDKDYKSDIDAKAIVLPSLRDIVLNKMPVSTTIVLDNNEHIDVKDIRIMKDMFLKQNVSYLELLYTDYFIINDKFFKYITELLNMRDEISSINKNQFLKGIKGMSMEKFKALEHPYPTIADKIEKYGYDPKQLHHIVRLNEFVNRYLQGEKLKDCYVSILPEYLIEIKKGKYDLEIARKIATTFDILTKSICDANITEKNIINGNSIKKLEDWVMNVMTISLKEEIKNNGGK